MCECLYFLIDLLRAMTGPGREPTISDEEILAVFREASDPVLTTKEVADEIGLSRRGTFDRLSKLASEGTIEMKTVGETNAVWWLASVLRE